MNENDLGRDGHATYRRDADATVADAARRYLALPWLATAFMAAAIASWSPR
jgi:hypothetical protein